MHVHAYMHAQLRKALNERKRLETGVGGVVRELDAARQEAKKASEEAAELRGKNASNSELKAPKKPSAEAE